MLPDKLYDVLKWVCIICLPAIVVCIKTTFPVWDVPADLTDKITVTIMAADALLGALIGVSTARYNSKEKE